MMNIIFDLIHPAHLNLFKNTIKYLYKNNHKIIVTCINRGTLPQIIKKELYPIPVKAIGNHGGSIFSIIFKANLLRFFQMYFFLYGEKLDLGLSFGSFILGAVLKLFRIPNVHFSDDPERKINAILELITCNERHIPSFISAKGKTKTFYALKEWAYLSPKYFVPKEEILIKYHIKKKKYIFIREVSTGSLNYIKQDAGIISKFAKYLPKEYKVILSLEDKKRINDYPQDWQVLNEPVDNIHSIIYYSKLLISSGDSMAREGAMLGVPSIYCGDRNMKANDILIDYKMLFKVDSKDILSFIKKVLSDDFLTKSQSEFRNILLEEWIDLTEYINKVILDYEQRKN